MPVNVDKNLTLKNNTMDASYDELFKKLNVAYAWTHTQTTSSGGTAVVLVNNGDILTTMECNDINKCSMSNRCITSSYSSVWNTCIIDGKIYIFNGSTLRRLGEKNDYVAVATSNYNNNDTKIGLDSSGRLWYISNTETQIGNDSNWYNLGYGEYYGDTSCALNNGKIYALYRDNTPEQKYTNLTNIIKMYARGDSSKYVKGYCIDSNNNLYYLNGTNSSMVSSGILWKDICSGSYNSVIALNNNDDAYFIDGANVYKQNISNVKKYMYGHHIALITNDKKLYIAQNTTTKYGENYGAYINISNDIEWDDIGLLAYGSNYSYWYFYGIGNGKLYKIIVTNASISAETATVSYTQIGTEENYVKVEGEYYGASNANIVAVAWTGDATSVSHTVFTTKAPQAGDEIYIDEDLTNYSYVQTTGVGTITDQFRTYNRDVVKDSNFTAIPSATTHETVSTIDFLRITNPNT